MEVDLGVLDQAEQVLHAVAPEGQSVVTILR
jgi:hypothetical protein